MFVMYCIHNVCDVLYSQYFQQHVVATITASHICTFVF